MSGPFFRDKVVLITGASAGIGEELARQLARAGARLTLTARRKERLESLAQQIVQAGGQPPLAVQTDVTHDGDVERAVQETIDKWGRVDAVIANAGFSVVGMMERLSIADYRRQFETNVFGVLRTIYATLPELQKARGNLAIIGSVAGWGATPGASPYAMSKFALRALADAITPELQLQGVKVTLISPGFVDSDIRRTDNNGQFHESMADQVPTWLVMRTKPAVRQILRAVARGQREAIITSHGKVLVALQRFAPWTIRRAAKWIAVRRRLNR